MNLYKVAFVGYEMEYELILVGGDTESRKKEQAKIKKKKEHYIYQTYAWANNAKHVISVVECDAGAVGITVEDFHKISLVCSKKVIGQFMKEKL